MLLLLVTLVCGGSNAEISHHLDIAVDVPREQQVSDDRLQSLVDSQSHLLTPPESQPIREKVRAGTLTRLPAIRYSGLISLCIKLYNILLRPFSLQVRSGQEDSLVIV